MGLHDFTPAGMRRSHMIPLEWNGIYLDNDEKPAVVTVNITQPAPIKIKEDKKNAGNELKELLNSIEGMSDAEKKFAIKAHYGLLTERDIDSIV